MCGVNRECPPDNKMMPDACGICGGDNKDESSCHANGIAQKEKKKGDE